MRYRKFSASSLALAFAAVIPLIFFGATIVSTCAFSQEVVTVGPSSLPNGSVGKPYNQLIRATDNDSDDDDFFTNDPEDSYTYAVTAGSLPPGLTLGSGPATAAGQPLSGTPTTAGSYTFTITATMADGSGSTGSTTYNAVIIYLGVSPASLPNGTVGVPYNQTVSASGGTGPYTFAVASGTLPAGLSLDPLTGVISGTPTTGNTSYSFVIRAVDSVGNTGNSSPYTVNIAAGPLTVSPVSLPNGMQGTAYNQTVSASGGTGPYTFAVSAGSLPTGLSLNANTGAISGTPTAGNNSYTFTIQATDSFGGSGNRSYTVGIGSASLLAVSPTSLPNGTTTVAYNQTVSASGGTGPYNFAVSSGTLPPGLALDANTGAITGMPTASGSYNFTILATDSIGNTGSQAFPVKIGSNSLTVSPASLPNGTTNAAYNQTVSVSGGAGPYTFAVSSGTLPPGLALDANTGAITGTPTVVGSYNFSIQASDSIGNIGIRPYAVKIGSNSLTINPATLPASVAGRPYSAALVASGGTGPYAYSVSAGALPPGLALNASSGLISGTVVAGGSYSFTIRALDVNGNTGSRAYTLTNRPDPALDPEVIGLVNAQVAAARRFASAQIDNLTRHLERLHNFNPCSVDFGVSLPRTSDTRGQLYPGSSPYSLSPGNAAGSFDPNSPAGQVARRMPGSQDCEENGGWTSKFAAWAMGSVQFGTVMPDGSVGGGRFTTAGLTAGVDWRVHSDLVVGAAVGYGSDRATVGSLGTSSNSTSFSGALYASYSAFDPWFIDATVGYGQLGYDNRRYVTDDATTVTGSRKGAYWFGAATVGYEFKYRGIHVSPYVRADFMQAQLDSYAEQGASSQSLSFAAMKFHSLGGTAGLRGSYDIPMSWGVLTPNARVEYRATIDGAFQQSMNFTDIGPSVSSTLVGAGTTTGTINTSLGVRARSLRGISGELEYGTSSGAGKVQSQTIRAGLKVPF